MLLIWFLCVAFSTKGRERFSDHQSHVSAVLVVSYVTKKTIDKIMVISKILMTMVDY